MSSSELALFLRRAEKESGESNFLSSAKLFRYEKAGRNSLLAERAKGREEFMLSAAWRRERERTCWRMV